MPQYLAMCRKIGEAIPHKISLTAITVMNGIEKMCQAAGVKDTNDLDAFELLEVLESGNAYVPVAYKDNDAKDKHLARRASRSPQLLTGPASGCSTATCEELLFEAPEVEAA